MALVAGLARVQKPWQLARRGNRRQDAKTQLAREKDKRVVDQDGQSWVISIKIGSEILHLVFFRIMGNRHACFLPLINWTLNV